MSDANHLLGQARRATRWRVTHLVAVNAIFLLRMLVLARLLGPESFGLFAVAMLPIGLLLNATEFGMISALVQARSPSPRQYDVAWTLSTSRGVVVAATIFFGAPWLAQIAGQPEAVPLTRVLALHPLLLAVCSIRLADLQRNLDFRNLAMLALAEALANTAFALAFASKLGAWALVLGVVAGSATRLGMSYFIGPHVPRFVFDRSTARGLIKFGRWIFVTALVSTLAASILQIIISRQLGAAELGIYYLASRLIFLLYGNLIDVNTSVAFPVYARLQNDHHQLIRVFRSTLVITVTLVVPVFVLASVLAHSLVAEVLGPEWQGTEPVIRVLGLVCIVAIIGDSTNALWNGKGQPWRTTVAETIQMVLLLTGALLLTEELGVTGAAMAWLPATIVTQVITIVFLHRVATRPFQGTIPVAIVILLSNVVSATAALWIDGKLFGIVGLLAASFTGLGIYIGALWFCDRRLKLGLADTVRRAFPQLDRFGWNSSRR